MASLLFRQLFDQKSSTYTYIIADLVLKNAILIDTVREQFDRDSKLLDELGIKTLSLLNTHIHADHVTANHLFKLKFKSSATSYISKYYVSSDAKADKHIGEKDSVQLSKGGFKISFLHTPGHTEGCLSIVDHSHKRVFTGDTLLIRGCGRTDFQGGSADQLYQSIHEKLFKLPLDYTVYPAHDYNGRTASSIFEEINFNPRLTKTQAEFIKLMNELQLARPKMIDLAVPANLNCGLLHGDEIINDK